MCGIAGLFDLTDDARPVAAETLEPMLRPIASRGPDGTGVHVEPGLGLAHARLAIIDLETGDQPVWNEDGSVWVVFNGEIFNYLELRRELIDLGHRFRSAGDTEVLVHAYEQWGDDFVHRLNGQFAFALWDRHRRRLLLTRDRPGILPLFFARHDGWLVFGSEVKALLPVLGPPRLNAAALDALMTFWAPASPDTLFDGVEEVGPGEMVIAEGGRLTRRRYWEWAFADRDERLAGTPDALAEELHGLLADATRLRLRADVPVGAYLSGGLDSSVLTALIHHHGDAALRTFSIGFADKGLDETSHQDAMVRHLGTDHARVLCSEGDIAARFPSAIWRAEAPVLRTAPVPMGMLSGLARDRGYRVVLTGEGADEVLGGYDLFKEAKVRAFWARQPDSAWRAALLKRLYPYLDLGQAQSLAYLKQFFGNGLDDPGGAFFSHLPRWASTARAKLFFSDDLVERLRGSDAEATLAARMPRAFKGWSMFERAQYLEARTLMSGYLLSSQGDRMLMANSVEGRFPFLDHRVIEFANRLDPRLKMRVLNEKWLLKRAMARYLPESVLNRHKQPYRAPDIPAFFRDGVPDYVEDLMSESRVRAFGYFDPGRVARLFEKARRGRATGPGDSMAFVGILSTQLWHHHFIEQYRGNFGASSDTPTILKQAEKV